jgi:hypothetical protein
VKFKSSENVFLPLSKVWCGKARRIIGMEIKSVLVRSVQKRQNYSLKSVKVTEE